MEQVAWAAIGILGASLLGLFGMLLHLGSRMDARFDALDGRIDTLGARLDARIDAVVARLDNLSERFTAHLEQHHSR